MDVFSHGLWGNIIVYKKLKNQPRHRWVAVAFGMLPDLIPFAPSFVYILVTRKEFWTLFSSNHWTVTFAEQGYNFTHSLVLFAIATLVVFALRKGRLYWPMLAWGLHILMDIPTHPDFYRTPFLFPISDYRVPFGVSWGTWWIFIPNWILLISWYAWWYFKGRKKA